MGVHEGVYITNCPRMAAVIDAKDANAFGDKGVLSFRFVIPKQRMQLCQSIMPAWNNLGMEISWDSLSSTSTPYVLSKLQHTPQKIHQTFPEAI